MKWPAATPRCCSPSPRFIFVAAEPIAVWQSPRGQWPGIRRCSHVSEAAWPLLEAVVNETTGASEWAAAAATLEAFVRRVPNCIPALVRLVEVAIDGGLEPIASKAQARL